MPISAQRAAANNPIADCPGHHQPPAAGRQKFFQRSSRSVATSSIDSANSFFSFRFSSSSAFNLRTSDTSMPPYFERQAARDYGDRSEMRLG